MNFKDLAELEQILDEFQHGMSCRTPLLARRRGRSPLNNANDKNNSGNDIVIK